MLLFLTALIMFLTDNIIMFFCISLPECAILSVKTCPWAFLFAISLSAGDAVLPDIAIKTNKIQKINTNKLKYFNFFANTIR